MSRRGFRGNLSQKEFREGNNDTWDDWDDASENCVRGTHRGNRFNHTNGMRRATGRHGGSTYNDGTEHNYERSYQRGRNFYRNERNNEQSGDYSNTHGRSRRGGFRSYPDKANRRGYDSRVSGREDTFEEQGFNDRFSKSVKVNDSFESHPHREAVREAVTYVPPEFDDSEQSIFSRGIKQGINFDKYDSVKVKVTGGQESIEPIDSFDHLPIQTVLKDNIRLCYYKRPTPIQRFAIPILLKNRDIMACAQTGSGKTAAFILPIFDRILRDELYASVTEECCHPRALVIVPTRELVIQTFAECKKFSYNTRIKTAQVYGGVSVIHQLNQLRVGNEVIVGTTGRLLDMIRRGAIYLDKCVFLVLDEADRMLDMGFEPDVREIIKRGGMGVKRCTAMFSATFPPEVQTLAQDFLCHDYSFITVGVVGGACRDVTQEILLVERTEKRNKLKEILTELGEAKTLVFVEQKRFADFLASDLNQCGFRTTSIHGDRMQKEREEALRDFVRGNMPYLVATSVAARGLDIPGVDNVINYDLPDSITEYVHRIGRTGRCGNPGKSISFYDPIEERCTRLAGSLVNVLTDAGQPVPDFLSGRYFAAEEDSHGDNARQDIRGAGNYTDGQSNYPPRRQSALETQCDDDSWD